MSTETLKYPYGQGPDGGGRMLVFLAVSVLIHVALLLSFWFFGSPGSIVDRLFKEKEDDLMVDVIELPPADARALSKDEKKATYYAERSRSVVKETYPAQAAGVKRPHAVIIPGKGAFTAGETPQRPTGGIGEASKEVKRTGLPAKESASAGSPDLVEPARTGEKEASQAGATKPEPLEPIKSARAKETPKASQGRPNLFLTEERLAELTKKYEAEAPKGEQGKTLQLNTSELRYSRYLLGMKDRIQLYWEYPDVAAREGWHGRLRIDFVINRDGTVSGIKLVKSSNYPVLDDAAMTALKLASPFQPFPADFAVDSILIRGSFEYSFYGREGR